MNAPARLLTTGTAPIGAACATALGRVLRRLETARGPSRDLDAEIYTALGWQVERVPGLAWRARGPAAATWSRLPNPTEDMAQAKRLVPWGWEWGCGWRDRTGPNAWCRDPRAETVFFEINARTEALALVSAALFGQRALLEREEAQSAAALYSPIDEAPDDRVEGELCGCGWFGPLLALRAGRCPDCARAVEVADA
jgi:hypothetical protein